MRFAIYNWIQILGCDQHLTRNYSMLTVEKMFTFSVFTKKNLYNHKVAKTPILRLQATVQIKS